MKKRTGTIFWGGFFLSLGTLILLAKYNLIESDWDFIWSLYPVIFVFIGVLILAKDSLVRPLTSGIFGVFVAVLIFGSVNNFVFEVNFDWDSDDYEYTYFSEEYDSDYKFASLSLKGGAGHFIIDNRTDDLVDAKSYGALGDYRFRVSDDYDRAHVSFTQRSNDFKVFTDNLKNRLKIALNTKPIWSFDLDFGGARADFDLSGYRVETVDIETGASDIYLKLGDLYEETFVDVKMGMASLEIKIPKNSGCRLYGDMVLFSKELEGMDGYRASNDSYVTENFNTAANKITVKIEGGVSKLRIDRY